MKHTKKIISSITIIFISVFTFFNGYNMVKDSYFSYAEINDNILWQPLNSEHQLVEAFQYYCKSRDLTIEGSIADAVTTATTGTFNGLCNKLGIDITALQAELKYATDGNQGIQFLFTSNGITAYNRIFAQFLQDNELSVGDTNVNKNLYDGRYYEDKEDNNTLVFVYSSQNDVAGSYTPTEKGTYYLYPYEFFVSNTSSFTVTNTFLGATGEYPYVMHFDYTDNGTYKATSLNYNSNSINKYMYYFRSSDNDTIKSYPAILYNSASNTLWLGSYTFYNGNSAVNFVNAQYRISSNSTSISQSAPTVNINIVSNEINNNNYEGDTIINNYGTPSEPDTPQPTPEPDYSPAEDWDIQLPDLDIPNWIISGKENKFPFDIPFNVMYALSLLQAEPEAPHLEGTMNFGFTTWEYDLDLSDFDSVALICRNMEFLAFLTGLMLMTRKLIWG